MWSKFAVNLQTVVNSVKRWDNIRKCEILENKRERKKIVDY